MLKKRAQVTTFIIIGIIVAIVIFVAFFFFGEQLTGQQDTTPLDNAQLIPIREHVESCMQESLQTTLDTLKKYAGFLTTTQYTLTYAESPVNYLVFPEGAVNKMNPLSGVEETLAEQITSSVVEDCEFKDFNVGIKANKDVAKSAVDINSDNILVTLTYPVTVSKGSTSAELREFSIIKQSDFGKIYQAVQDIVNAEVTNGFDSNRYFLQHPDIIVHKENININTAVYLVTSNEEEEFVFFGVRK